MLLGYGTCSANPALRNDPPRNGQTTLSDECRRQGISAERDKSSGNVTVYVPRNENSSPRSDVNATVSRNETFQSSHDTRSGLQDNQQSYNASRSSYTIRSGKEDDVDIRCYQK